MLAFYLLVKDVVCNLNLCSEQELLHSKQEYLTDARYLLVFLLRKKLTNQEIVRLTHLPKQSISRIVNGYDCRKKQKYSLRCMQQEAENIMNKSINLVPQLSLYS